MGMSLGNDGRKEDWDCSLWQWRVPLADYWRGGLQWVVSGEEIGPEWEELESCIKLVSQLTVKEMSLLWLYGTEDYLNLIFLTLQLIFG